MTKSTTAPAGGRRFWITVLCFAIANLAVWVGYIQWQKIHRHHLLEITQFTPGDGSLVDGRPTLCWSFNLDVAAPAPNNPPPGQLTPAVAGKWEWPDARTLKFTPDAPLPRATPISVTLNADALHTPDGFRLARPYVTALHTAPLEVIEARQVSFDDGNHVTLKLTFNDKVLPADVLKHLTLHGGSGKPLPFHAEGEAAARSVNIVSDPLRPADMNPAARVLSLDVHVEKGLAGESGPLGLPADYHQTVTIASYLLATDAEAYFPASDDAFVRIRFNNSVDADLIRPVLSLTPAIAFTVTPNSDTLELHGAFQPGTRYSIKIAASPAGVASRKMPRPTSFSVLVPDRSAGLWFESQVGYLSAEGNRAVMAHAVNMTDLRATVTRVYDNNLVAWRNDDGRRYSRNSLDDFSRPVAVHDIHLPTRKNEKQDIRLSLDELLPAGEARDGVYRIALTGIQADASTPAWSNEDNDDESDRYTGRSYGGASTVVTLSDIGLTAKQGKNGITVWATSLRTAKPTPGVHTRVFSNKNQLLGEATTNADGLATVMLMPAAPGERATVVIADQPQGVEVRDEDREQHHEPEARRASARVAGSKSAGQGLTWLDLNQGAVNFGDADVAGRAYLRHGFQAFVYTDRGVYRPGETVHLRAIVRGPDNATPPRFPIRWQIRRPDLHDWKAQMGEVDADGATSFDLVLPTDLPSGRWTAEVGLPHEPGTTARFFGSVAFDIEDFMPQRMKVSVEIGQAAGAEKAAERLALGDDPITAHVQADYLFGRPVAERPATMVVRLDPVAFAPRGFGEWTFGDEANTAEPLGHAAQLGRRAELPEVELDAKGHAKFDIDIAELIEKGEVQGEDSGKPVLAGAHHRGSRRAARAAVTAEGDSASDYAGPWRLSVTGSVTETGGRAITAGRQVDLDRAPYYIGLKARETSPRPGVTCNYDIQLVTPSGAVAATDQTLDFTLMRETWNSSYVYEDSHYRFHSTRILEPIGKAPRTISITQGRGEIAIVPPSGGSYVLIARDAKTGGVTSVSFYAGYGMWQDNISRQNPERLDLLVQPMPVQTLLDAALSAIEAGDLHELLSLGGRATVLPPRDGKLHVGQPAQVIVRSPFAGQLLLSVETDGVLSTQVLEMPENHIAVPIELSEACRPNAYVTATVVRAMDPNAKWMIHRAIGVERVMIDNTDRKLNVQLAAPAEIRPQASLGVKLRVLDSAGNPVPNAAITVAAVDEGICQLTDFKTPDPFAYFTAKCALGVHSADLFGELMPETPSAEKQSAVGGDDGSAFGLKRGTPVGARRVKPVALVSNVLHTDANGLAGADFSTPQFVGQLRVMVVASADNRFGSAEGPVLVRSPVLVQSSWPRFAAPGDRFTVPLTVFNNGKLPDEVNVTIDVEGPLLAAPDPNKPEPARNRKRITLPPIMTHPGGQATAAFDITAQDQIGVAHAHLIAKMGTEMFEEDVELPVRPASPTVTDGAYLVARPDAPAKMEIPAGFVDGTTQYELRVSTTQQLQLPEGLDYLDHYPYGCLEQTTSTLFPLVYLNDIGEQIAPGLFEKSRVEDKVQVGMLRMLSMQTSDGGLAMWPGGRQDWEWGSVYAAHFVVEAQAAGFDVPEELRDPLLKYLGGLLNQPEQTTGTIELQSYAAYVLALAGKPPRPVMGRLSEVLKSEEAGSARFHLAAAWLAAGRRDLAATLLPSGIPAPRADRDLSGNVGSGVRDRAILISTLLAVTPDDPRIGGLVQKLADGGRAHEWRSTQDTAFAVMAIGRYLRHARTQTPYETAELLLDGKTVATSEAGKPLIWNAASLNAGGETGKRANAVKLPPAGSKLEVRVSGLPNAIAQVAWLETGVRAKPPASVDNGMSIHRRYLDEHGKPLAAMSVRSGDLMQVELTVQSADPLDNLVIEDLLPAGLEIENPHLLGNAAGVAVAPKHHRQPADESGNVDDNPAFVSVRADMRDDRLILVGHLARSGVGTYLYTARAVTPGKYVLPPVKGECMYDSGINSLFGAGTFEVLPASGVKVAQVDK